MAHSSIELGQIQPIPPNVTLSVDDENYITHITTPTLSEPPVSPLIETARWRRHKNRTANTPFMILLIVMASLLALALCLLFCRQFLNRK